MGLVVEGHPQVLQDGTGAVVLLGSSWILTHDRIHFSAIRDSNAGRGVLSSYDAYFFGFERAQ